MTSFQIVSRMEKKEKKKKKALGILWTSKQDTRTCFQFSNTQKCHSLSFQKESFPPSAVIPTSGTAMVRRGDPPAQGTLGPDLPQLTEGQFQGLKRSEVHFRDLNTAPFANLNPGANAHNWIISQWAAAGCRSLNQALPRECQ